jgi:FkbH-like protein
VSQGNARTTVANEGPLTYRDATIRVRALASDGVHRAPLRIALAGNANLDFLTPGLRVQLAAEGFDAEVRSSAYGNWISETFVEAPGSRADIWIIWLSGMGATRGMTERPEIDVASIADATERLLARGARVVFVPPESVAVEDDPFSPFTRWRLALITQLHTQLPAGVVQLSIDHLVRRTGMTSWTATRYWEQAKAPCHPDAATIVGLEIAGVLARMLRPAIRAVAVDLDNTLWGGIVGEVGPEGLDLDPDGAGRPFLELQRLLLDLSDRGIPIGVVSKNDDAQARRPFTERHEMVLELSSLVSFDASWNPKYEALQQFAAKLNIGIDSICFLDDSISERDEARRMLPGLVVPELPESPAHRVEYLLRSRLFTTPIVSEEDRARVEFFKRESTPPPADLDEYLANLDMSLEAVPISTASVDRVLALLHKTNQFNATLWRPTPSELAAFLIQDKRYAYSFRLTDRLGDAGIIAVLLARPRSDVATVEGWVMSCRVFGRGVEWAILDHLSSWLAATGASSVEVPYNRGPRNALVGDVLTTAGLTAGHSGHDVNCFSASGLTTPKHHITIVEQ